MKGLRIHYRERKAGRNAVLFVHGNSSSGKVFERQLCMLSNLGWSVVIPDLPGHGDSDDALHPSSTYSFPGYAEILDRLMAELGYKTVCIVGWSLGGHIALELLAKSSRFSAALISGTPPVALDPESISSGFRWTPATALAARGRFTPDDVRRYVAAMLGSSSPRKDHVEAAARTDGRARVWMVGNGMAGRGENGRRVVETSDKHLAVVQGARDPFVRSEYVSSLRFKNIWRSAPTFLECGHAPHWEMPERFNGLLRGFLDHVDDDARKLR